MSVEARRGCGFREVKKLYLVGEYTPVFCDRLPLPIGECPYCHQGIHFVRSFTKLDALKMFGLHGDVCKDEHRPCFICDPTNKPSYVMMVGENSYPTPQDFMVEAEAQGISKKIPFIPKDMKLGETVLYLAHNKACEVPDNTPDKPSVLKEAESILEQTRMVDTPKVKKALGIFTAFIPQRVEMLFYESEITEKLKAKMAKRGISIISVTDGDPDHMPIKKRRILKRKERRMQRKLTNLNKKKRTSKKGKQTEFPI
jgi:hypothetical protein